MIVFDSKELCYTDYIGKCRVLSIDYGDKRVGVAVSDINWRIASPLKVLESHGVYNELFQLILDYSIGIVVVGAPKALNGGESGKQFEKVKKFVEKLEELSVSKSLDIKIIYWDERLSSVAANRFLDESEMSISRKKKNIDKVAASFILQGFLDYVDFL